MALLAGPDTLIYLSAQQRYCVVQEFDVSTNGGADFA